MKQFQPGTAHIGRGQRVTLKRQALTTASALALLGAATPGLAQETAKPQAAAVAVEEEIVVTGTRVVRDGYEAPTPVSVLGIEEIQRSAPANLADFVNQLPSLAGSQTPQTTRQSVSAGQAGLNTMNLRGMGTSRTLVLLDGQRSVAGTPTGDTDTSSFPQGLVSRVDVVTGGASAVYGSDALAGVVNFVLDRTFTGIKGDVQGGITTYGDNANWKVTLTAGTPFSGGRGHLLLNGEVSDVAGIIDYPRDWNREGWKIITNPAYGTNAALGQSTSVPERILVAQAAPSNMTPGGIITAGPLKGIAFGPGGAPYNFQYGSLILDPWMVGGEWRANDPSDVSVTMEPSNSRQNVFTRISYEISDNVEVFAQATWARSYTDTRAAANFNQGNLTIQADNAFIPQVVRDRMTALALTNLRMGSMSIDLPYITAGPAERFTNRYVIGAEGSFGAFGGNWDWDIYYQKGKTRRSYRFTDRIIDNYNRAIDAVRHPTTGITVCRSSIANPNNGCIPFNVFGIGVNTQAAVGYSSGIFYNYERYLQDVAAVSFSGEPFDLWAGPVSLAFGAEHRKEDGDGITNDLAAANRAAVGNQSPTFGSYSVTEGFIETVVPLAKGEDWADALDLTAAVRFTDYSVSGYVTTWKVGATYSPVSDIRFRVTRSRDIRAPHRVELFAAGIFVGNTFLDPFRNNTPTNLNVLTTGNINLKPEKADTTGIGVVLQPSFLAGFSAAIDYYNINIKDAIGSVGSTPTLNRCFGGEQIFCDAIIRGPAIPPETIGPITVIRVQPTNFLVQIARGLDFEASYTTPMDALMSSWSGNLTLRGLATHFITNRTDDGLGLITENAGQNSAGGPPDWKYQLSAAYSTDRFSTSLTARGVSSGVYLNSNVECTTGCPVSTVNNRTQNINHIDGALYFDAAFSYKIRTLADDGTDLEAFLSVRNLSNKDPALVGSGPGGVAFSTAAANPSLYDILGRQFRAGIRFRM